MKELPKSIDSTIEKKWQEFWKKNQVFRFVLDEASEQKEVFVIDSPPPFTSGNLHMGHVLSYSYFDFVAKYKKMKGFNVFFPQGWDCQGFPTEVKVEKKYGKSSPEQFRKHCVDWTEQCIANMKRQMISLGFCPDWNYEYKTMDPSYHRKVQLSVLRMYQKGQIYRASHPVYWCVSCQSALSKTDTEDIVRSATLYTLIFELEGENNQELHIATTRPELLHAIVAVLYNPADERYKKFLGKKLFVKSPFGKSVPLLADNDVDREFGTGLVMVCTFGDKQDVIWTYRHNLPQVEAISKDGKLINAGDFSGLNIREAKEKIVESLEKNKKIVSKQTIQQTIKIHDRCSTAVEFLNSFQWFAKITDKADKIISTARQIKWYPEFAIAHLINWANYVEWDWVISRQRIFGTPIPFWICKNCSFIVEPAEEELPVYPLGTTRKCPKCGGEAEGESSVFDCWVDSSITPLIISKWEEDSKFFSKTYPASLRPQGVEIIRTWAFYTIYRCFELTSRAPFREILLNGNVLAPDGKKMSKSLGNIIEPDDLLKQYGADAIRIWAALSGAMAKDRPFSYQDITFGKNFVNKVLNAGRLILNFYFKFRDVNFDLSYYSNLSSFSEIDKYYLSKFYYLVERVNKHWENYEFHHIMKEISNFFWHEFCDYYIEFVKYRLYSEQDNSAKEAAMVLFNIYKNTLLLLAPFIPFCTEEIWSLIKKDQNSSIFYEKYPSPQDIKSFKIFLEEELEDYKIFEQIVDLIKKEKTKKNLKLKDKVECLKIFCPEQKIKILQNFQEDILKTFNILSIVYNNSNELSLQLE
ncbi:MAG: valine--tRNA ligase [Candidatus Anstonellaceae archaeon]